MKKFSLFLILIISFFAFSCKTVATSGCCSSHGGVDCSSTQYNGNVVCNDGWEGSSCSYGSMAMCQLSDGSSNSIYIWGIIIIAGVFVVASLKKRNK